MPINANSDRMRTSIVQIYGQLQFTRSSQTVSAFCRADIGRWWW